MPECKHTRSSTRSSARISLLMGCALLAAIAVVSTFFMEKQYKAEFKRIDEQNMFIARLIAYHTSDILNAINQELHTIHSALRLSLEAHERDQHHDHDYLVVKLLQDSRRFNPFILDLIISDPEGKTLHWVGRNAPFDLSENSLIKAHVNKISGNNLYVSNELHSDETDGSPYFRVSAGFMDEKGNLETIYTALIDYSHFRNDFANLGLPEGTSIGLGTNSGNIIIRIPGSASSTEHSELIKQIWQNGERAGGTMLISQFDNNRRKVMFTRVGDYPFFAYASTSEEEILSEWWLYFWTLISGYAILLSISIYAYILFARHQKQVIKNQDILEEQALLDPLTKLANRRKFYPAMDREFGLASRHNRPLSLLTIDIDRFKLVNDHYGHDAGDQVIVAIAETIKDQCRGTDISCRLGGEEFAILLSNTGLKGANIVAEKLRRLIESLYIETGYKTIQVTVSIGISCYEEGDKKPKEMMNRSDAALYKAKHMGRNCIFTQKRNDTMPL